MKIKVFANKRNRQVIFKNRYNRRVYPRRTNDGYESFSVDYVRHIFCHRLVANKYVHNPLPGVFTIVDHIDGVRHNNWPSNLRWVNHALNTCNNRSLNVQVDKRRVRAKIPACFCSYLTRSPNGKFERYNVSYHTTFKDAHQASKQKKIERFDKLYKEIKSKHKEQWVDDPSPKRKTKSTSQTSSSRSNYFLHL